MACRDQNYKVCRLMARVFLIASTIGLSACGFYGSGKSGKVVEEGTNKPIEGAMVSVLWHGSYLITHGSTCFNVNVTTTDKEGNYRVSSWLRWTRSWPAKGSAYTIKVYKKGYSTEPGMEEAKLRRFTGSNSVRLKQLMGIARSTVCMVGDETAIRLLPFYKKLDDEVKELGIAENAAGPNDYIEQLITEIEKRFSKTSTLDQNGKTFYVMLGGVN